MSQNSITDFETVNIEDYVDQFKALSDPVRLKIISLLASNGKMCVCDLEESLSMPQSKLSYHIKILLKAELIHKEVSATWSYYWINRENLRKLLSDEFCQILHANDENYC